MAGVQAGGSAGRLSIDLVVKIAQLQADLNKAKSMVAAASKDIGTSARSANDNLASMGVTMTKVGGVSKAMGANSVNLARNLSDVAQGFALGQKPMTIFLQQGFQITEILALMRAEAAASGTSLTAMFGSFLKRNAGIMTGLAGIVAALAAVAGGFDLADREFSKHHKNVTDGLGLTETQLDHLKKKGVDTGITLGDTFKGFTQTLGETFDGPLKGFSDTWNSVMDSITQAGINAIKEVGGAFAGSYAAIVDIWDDLPAVFSDLFYQGVNLGIEAFNGLLTYLRTGWVKDLLNLFNTVGQFFYEVFQKAVNLVVEAHKWLADKWMSAIQNMAGNWGTFVTDLPALIGSALVKIGSMFAEMVNGWLKSLGDFARKVATSDFGPINNPDAGKAAAAAQKAGEAYERGYKAWGEGVDNFGKAWERNSAKIAQARVLAGAGDPGKADKDTHAETLAREMDATEALIASLYKLVAAYKDGEAAAMKEEIAAKAIEEAIKKRADVTVYVAQQLRKAVAEQVVASVKSISTMSSQNDAQEAVNKAVAAGTFTVDQAADALARLNQQRALVNTIKLAELTHDAEGAKVARAALEALNKEQQRTIALRKQAEDLAATAQTNRNIAAIQDEIALQQQVGAARLEALKGLSGDALENELARISVEYEKQNILLQAQAAAAHESALGHFENAKAILAEAQARVGQVGLKGAFDDAERQLEQDRKRALDTAHEIGNIIGGSVGQAIGDLADALDKAFPKFFASLGSKFGGLFKDFNEGANIGSAINGIFGGSKAGSQIGGGIGQIAGNALASSLGRLGAAAGPIGAIAGSILGGIIGGMLKSTPRASATVSVIAGEAMDAAVKGSSAKLKAVAGKMADGVIDGLQQLADALGAELTGNAAVSIGMRNGNYRVDTTGSGITKTSKGAVDFGDDQAAAIAFALQDAIKDGVLGGLSASLQKLISGDGDLQTQLQKALSFKDVFDQLAQHDDPAKYAQDQITKWHDAMAKIFAEAGATSDELAELERLTGIKRVDAAAEAAKAIEQADTVANDQRKLEIQIMELTGDTLGALAAQRVDEKAAADASLGPLYDRIYALQDEQTAAADAAAAAEKAAEIDRTVRGIQADILEVQGKAAEAQAIRDQLELEGLDPLIAAYKQQYFTARDAADAAKVLADAQADQAASAQRIADERYGLETQLLQAQGNTTELRARELAALDESNRSIQQAIYTAQDAAAAQDALATAQQQAADAAVQAASRMASLQERLLTAQGDTAGLTAFQRTQELAQAQSDAERAMLQQIYTAEDAAAAAKALADAQAAAAQAAQQAAQDAAQIEQQRAQLQIQILTLEGKTAEATAMQRQIELAAMDASLRPLQQRIYALQDAAQAEQERNDAIAKAKDVLSAAYQRESSALQDTIDKFKDFGDSLREFRSTLFATSDGTAASYARAQSLFVDTASAARLGDQAALGKLAGVGKDFLDASMGRAASLVDYQRDVARVARAVDDAIGAADAAVDYNQLQLDALDRSVDGLVDVKDAVVSVHDAILALQQQMASGQADTDAALTSIAVSNNSMKRFFDRADGGDFLKIGNDTDTPITVAP